MGNRNGNDVFPASCLKGHVTGVQWEYQGNYGLIDVAIECSDGRTHRSTNNNDGSWNSWMKPCGSDKGFERIGAQYQGGYGLVNAKTDCGVSNSNENGSWNRDLKCPRGQLMMGIQVNEQGGYGIVNFRIKCDKA